MQFNKTCNVQSQSLDKLYVESKLQYLKFGSKINVKF